MAGPHASLPAHPSLESLRKQAKRLFKELCSGDSDAVECMKEHHPRPPSAPSLGDAQLVVARRYGFISWAKLKQHVEETQRKLADLNALSSEFLDMACLGTGSERPSRIGRARRILAETPAVGSTSLFAAAASGNIAAATRMLDEDPDLVSRRGGPRGWDPLLYLCFSRVGDAAPGGDALALAGLLLERGADPRTEFIAHGQVRFTALTGAFGEGERGVQIQPPHEHRMALARLLLDAGADVNESQGLYNTCFTPADECLELLLERGLSASDPVNWAPAGTPTDDAPRILNFLLGQAAKNGFLERVDLLLEHGADPNSHDFYDDRSHYENALRAGDVATVERLRRAGAEPVTLQGSDAFRAACLRADEPASRAWLEEHPDALDDPTLLVESARRGRVDAVRLLVSLGAAVGAETETAATALHEAAIGGHLDVVKLLVEAGAPLDPRDEQFGGTPVGWAAHGGHRDVLDYLLELAENVFDLAAHGRADQLAALLARDPAATRARAVDASTPLHLLRDEMPQAARVVDLLLQYGADPSARNEAGETPVERLRSLECDELVELLLDRDAQA